MDLQGEADPKGDRVSITTSGKLLPYKTYRAAVLSTRPPLPPIDADSAAFKVRLAEDA